MNEKQTNWSGNYVYNALRLHRPQSVEQVQELMARSRKVRVLGTRHSFNAIADSLEDHISLGALAPVMTLDREQQTVTVDGGASYGRVSNELHREGYALHNLASLPHISVAGACATGTHGSGVGNGSLSTAVRAMEIVTAKGDVVTLSREQGERYQGAVVGLGGLGVVTKLTLDVVPAFEMRQDIYEDLPLAGVENWFDRVVSSAYSVSLFTDWRKPVFNQVWLKQRVADGQAPEVIGAKRATSPLHPLPGHSAENCTEQLGVPGPWHERLPHFRMDFTPSSGEELQSEYFVPRQHAAAALNVIAGLRDQISPLLLIAEVRTIAADTLWMSPCYEQDSVAFHFTWKKDWAAVQRLLPAIEEGLAPFGARPHWGKVFTMAPSRLQSLYPRLADFRALLREDDPEGKFSNAFLEEYIFGGS